MPSPEDIQDQQQLLYQYRRNLTRYLRQQAGFGNHVPIDILNNVEQARANVERIKSVLRLWGVQVEDLPNDIADNPELPNLLEKTILPIQRRRGLTPAFLIVSAILILFIIASSWFLLERSRILGTVTNRDAQIAQQSTDIVRQAADLARSYATESALATQAPTSPTVFIDNFKDRRPKDPVPLSLSDTTNISLTTRIENGKLVIIGKKGKFSQRAYTTNTRFNDFDMTINIDSIEGEGGSFIMNFRWNSDDWKSLVVYKFEIVFNQSSTSYYRVYTIAGIDGISYGAKQIYENTFPAISPVREIHILCKSDVCHFYINGQSVTPEKGIQGFRSVPGDITIDVAGEYIIRLDGITIKPAI